jgi:hypothetical protein
MISTSGYVSLLSINIAGANTRAERDNKERKRQRGADWGGRERDRERHSERHRETERESGFCPRHLVS